MFVSLSRLSLRLSLRRRDAVSSPVYPVSRYCEHYQSGIIVLIYTCLMYCRVAFCYLHSFTSQRTTSTNACVWRHDLAVQCVAVRQHERGFNDSDTDTDTDTTRLQPVRAHELAHQTSLPSASRREP